MLPVPKAEIVEARDTDSPETSCTVATYVAGTIADELCELGRGELFGATPVAPRAAIVTVRDCRDCPDLTHNPEVADSDPAPTTTAGAWPAAAEVFMCL
jgi:hypothetical protein